MLIFTPNVSWLYPELPFKERPAAVAHAGFRAIEFGFPSHADLDALQEAVEDYGLQIVLYLLGEPSQLMITGQMGIFTPQDRNHDGHIIDLNGLDHP